LLNGLKVCAKSFNLGSACLLLFIVVIVMVLSSGIFSLEIHGFVQIEVTFVLCYGVH
jgi:hypothetical protein